MNPVLFNDLSDISKRHLIERVVKIIHEHFARVCIYPPQFAVVFVAPGRGGNPEIGFGAMMRDDMREQIQTAVESTVVQFINQALAEAGKGSGADDTMDESRARTVGEAGGGDNGIDA